jgi:hypothetical protein
MVSSLFISSVLALSAVVSASTPLVARSVANVEAGKHIGVGDVGIAGVLNNALQVKNIGVHGEYWTT